MEIIESFFDKPVFGIEKNSKQKMLLDALNNLTLHHTKNCPQYRLIIEGIFADWQHKKDVSGIPYLPVSIFKTQKLMSIKDEELFKTMKSSGTSGTGHSQIYLDKFTSNLQAKALRKTMAFLFGEKRSPMMIIDSEMSLGYNSDFSARSAAIRGFSIFGREHFFALDEKFEIKTQEILKFFETHKDKKVFLFGFTFVIWETFMEKLAHLHGKIDMSNAIILHGGGWKKLSDKSVSGRVFKKCLNDAFGLKNIFDYYGMVEQTGSIYLECEEGFLHTSSLNDVLIRDPASLKIIRNNKAGLIQTISVLPYSYPGHSVLTEDIGIIHGEDDCGCGRKGKFFSVLGRATNAEIRGCSDAT